MGHQPEVILVEFNELCPDFLRQYMEQGIIPNFQRLYQSSRIMTTDAGEEPPNLEPWIQWLSVHSGLAFGEHGAFHLGDGRKLKEPCLAQLLSDAGIPVGVFMSMNTNYRRLNGYFIPDPWDSEGEASPAWLNTFYRTVANQVQESSRENSFSKKDMLKFGLFMLRHGLTAQTIKAILGQLRDERRDPGLRWRRASLVEHVAYDLFRSLNRRLRVRFATFFANSTAHYQHYFWRNQDPDQFQMKPAESDHPSLKHAIEFGYRSMDRIIGRMLRDYPDSTLMLCTALSQQRWDTTKCTFRPHKFDGLFQFAGIDPQSTVVKPVMAEQFHLLFHSPEEAQQAERQLLSLTVDGEQAMYVENHRDGSLFVGCQINDARVVEKQVTRADTGATIPFRDLFYMIHTVRSGRHSPEGVFWVRDPRAEHQNIGETIPLTAVAPMILRHFGLELPARMTADHPQLTSSGV